MAISAGIPDPNVLHPLPGQERVVLLRPLIDNPKIEVGEFSYYDDPDDATAFQDRNVLYGYGPEKLIIGKYCALAEGTRFIMAGANHPDLGVSTFPFTIFGGEWADRTLDIMTGMETKGDTVVGNDVWIGYRSLIMPGVTIGDGAIIASQSVVVADVPPYTIVGGNPGKVIRQRFADEDIERLLRARWWGWPVELVTEHVRVIMTGNAKEIEAIAAGNGLIE
ncbi:MAG TPA: CatB-related O-acetyltransferase [Pseudonocardiaceae bacterium]